MAQNDIYSNRRIRQMFYDCTQVVDQDGKDVKNRDLSVHITSSISCYEQNNSDLIIRSKREIENLSHKMREIELNSYEDFVIPQLNKQALKKTALSIRSTYITLIRDSNGTDKDIDFTKNSHRQKAINMICNRMDNCDDEVKSILKETFEELKSNQTSFAPITGIGKINRNNPHLRDFNNRIKKMNALCTKAKEGYEQNKNEYSPYTLPQIDFDNPQEEVKIEKQDPSNLYAEARYKAEQEYYANKKLQRKYTKEIVAEYHNLANSQLGKLLITEDFRKHTRYIDPDFVYERCFEGNGTAFNPSSPKRLASAINDYYYLQEKALQTVDKNFEYKNKGKRHRRKIIQEYLKSNPFTVADFLKEYPHKKYADFLCAHIRKINKRDYNWQIFDYALMGTGFVAGIAATIATGGAAAPLIAISLGAETIKTGSRYLHTRQIKQELHASKQSLATGQTTYEDALAYIEQVQKEHKDTRRYMLITLAGTATAGMSQGVKLLHNLVMAKKAKMVIKLLDIGVSSLWTNRIMISLKASIEDINWLLHTKRLHKDAFEGLTLEENTELAALFTRTKKDEEIHKHFIKALRQYKHPRQIKRFLRKLREDQKFGSVSNDEFYATILTAAKDLE